MKPSHGLGRTILALVTLMLVLVLPLSVARPAASQAPTPTEPAAQAEAPPAGGALATMPLTLPAREVSWRLTARQTGAESDPAVALEPGFVYALNDPLLLLFGGDVRLERVPMDEAIAIPEPVQGRPVAMMTETPVPYLAIELLDAGEELDDPEAVTYSVDAGEYELSLWRVDFANQVPAEMTERLASFTLPILAYVLIGEAYIPPPTSGEQPRHLVAGDWTVLRPGEQLAMAPNSTPPVLLFATIDQSNQAAQPAAPSSGPSAPQGSGSQAPTGGMTEPTGGNPQTTTAPTPEPTTEPTTAPTETATATATESATETATATETDTESESGSGGAAEPAPSRDLPIFTTDPDVANSRVTDTGVTSQVELTCTAFTADADGDGLGDECEKVYGTKSDVADSDGDSLNDGNEVNKYRTNPTNPDTDGDGLDDGADLGGGTDPLNPDFDGDGLLDGDEINVHGTYPKVADSDEDRLNDGEEVNLFGTKPLEWDTDQDGLLDGDEVYVHGTSPTDIYTDDDCLMDSEVTYPGTSPLRWDTDGDGYSDWLEVEYGGSPLDPGDTPSDGLLEPTFIDTYC